MNDELLIRVCCKTCQHYDGVCLLKVKGWLAVDPETYLCKHYDEREGLR